MREFKEVLKDISEIKDYNDVDQSLYYEAVYILRYSESSTVDKETVKTVSDFIDKINIGRLAHPVGAVNDEDEKVLLIDSYTYDDLARLGRRCPLCTVVIFLMMLAMAYLVRLNLESIKFVVLATIIVVTILKSLADIKVTYNNLGADIRTSVASASLLTLEEMEKLGYVEDAFKKRMSLLKEKGMYDDSVKAIEERYKNIARDTFNFYRVLADGEILYNTKIGG